MAGLRAALPPDFFHMIKPSTDPDFPWTGIFFGAPILGIWYWCTDQIIVQRVLGAKNEGERPRRRALRRPAQDPARVHPRAAGADRARAVPRQSPATTAYPTLVIRLLPTGLVGLMVAALLAALMSSLAAASTRLDAAHVGRLQEAASRDATEKQLVGVRPDRRRS